MEESILISTKKMLGIGDDTSFDHDILTHINAAFSHLQQLGIGPLVGYQITDDEPTWEDFLPPVDSETYLPILGAVKNNVFFHVRLWFDPPASSYILTSLEKLITESDFRLNVLRESTEWINPDPPDSDSEIAGEMVIDGGDPSG
jgi:hypothetical protein